VAGFLLQGITGKILEGNRGDSTMEEVKEQSLAIYENLKESAEYHIGLLEAQTQFL